MSTSSSIPPAALAPSRSETTARAAPAGPPRRTAGRRVPSEQILGGAAEIEIDHRGAIYRLRITALGKLILTK